MAIGTLGTPALLPANTPTTIYTVPNGRSAVVNISLVNITKNPVMVRIALTTAAAPTGADWLEYDVYLTPAADPSNGNKLEDTAIAIEGGVKVMVYANVAGAVSARVYGVEK